VIVLGSTGKNFAAGMSGGVAYVYDAENLFEQRCNRAMCGIERLADAEEINTLKGLVYRHLELTDSARAKEILADWPKSEKLFWKIAPLKPANTQKEAVLATTKSDPVVPQKA
jgi:glutamate synthase domain-containing protein 3